MWQIYWEGVSVCVSLPCLGHSSKDDVAGTIWRSCRCTQCVCVPWAGRTGQIRPSFCAETKLWANPGLFPHLDMYLHTSVQDLHICKRMCSCCTTADQFIFSSHLSGRYYRGPWRPINLHRGVKVGGYYGTLWSVCPFYKRLHTGAFAPQSLSWTHSWTCS